MQRVREVVRGPHADRLDLGLAAEALQLAGEVVGCVALGLGPRPAAGEGDEAVDRVGRWHCAVYEDAGYRATKCGGWESNPHALSGNGF